MSLANGRHYLAIPGPSVMPDRVLNAMHRAAPNIYAGELVEMTHALIPDLKKVARTDQQVAMYVANGHGAWEAALSNTLSRGDTVLVLGTGRFCHGWGEMAAKMGVQVQTIDFGKQGDIDASQVEDALRADGDHKISAVLSVQVDTSTSVRNDIPALRRAMDQSGHPALLMVDCIACLGCDVFEMDAWGVDVMVTGSQKGLMTPPGMSFVFFNEKADTLREKADCVTHYWDWRPRINPNGYYQYFDGTAPTHHLYGLRAALDMIFEEGLDNVWARHEKLSRMIWAAFEVWGTEGPMQLNISDPAKRSHAVTSVNIGAPNGTALRNWMINNAGVTLGIGLGMNTPDDPNGDGFFRVGHMGHVNAHMVMGLLGTLDTGLKALKIPHGEGALTAASTLMARS
ncbi:pyridoxal-phosphate-dependent aminotransferase family protein [Parasulfitobacter algicola]|uniref:Aminotransferase class V-fold PLP-dependent enzyme n=1 Tax=Parasulfitobacter algicola TaxID=2614809 RepID=A0ABX2IV80_9RHOB|nr:aminotransferase class V-fold PLP-dependent enzyme [Sulfitobacter algicola]NSX54955.1 aminotransferase class V-fold PLP-dependent enzyme [Sulfitobacter algicola]